jgi:hypothetical protein
VPAFLFDAPAAWDPEAHAASERSALSSDQCVIEEEQWFLRGLLTVPVAGSEAPSEDDLVFGVWLSVSEGTFDRAVELWEDERRVRDPAYPGWLANDLPGFPATVGVLARLKTMPVGKRPLVQLNAEDTHPLAAAVRDGVSPERAAELVAAVRAALS